MAGAYQVTQFDIGLLYGSVPLATAGNTSTTILSLTGTVSGVAGPVWFVATNTSVIGAGATFNVYCDGAGVTPTMTGVTPTVGVPVALTGAALGLSVTFAAGTSVNADSWKATAATTTDISGNLKDYTMATANRQPVVTTGLNGCPGLSFDAVNDYMSSSCNLPVPGTTAWIGLHVLRRPTTNAGFTRIMGDGADSTRLLATGATSIMNDIQNVTGPVGSGLPTNAWGVIEYRCGNSATDYIRCGSGAAVSGLAGANVASVGRTLSAINSPTGVEIIMTAYIPAALYNAVAFRSAVTAKYLGLVAVP